MSTSLIKTKENKIKIKLDKKLYPLNTIKKAFEEFKKVCECDLNNNELIFEDKETCYEFCNYLLGLMKTDGVV
jgi:hypothetical protein